MAKNPTGYINNSPDIAWWQSEAQLATEWRDKQLLKSRWPVWQAMYRNRWKANIVPLNLFYLMARTMVPKTYFRNPSVSVMPTKPHPANAAFAMIVQRLDSKLIRLMKLKEYMKRATQIAWFYGNAGLKVGFGSEYIATPDTILDSAPGRIDKTNLSWKTEFRDNVVAQMPIALPIHTGELLIPAGLKEREASRWRAHVFERPLQDLKDDERYSGTKDLGPTREIQVEGRTQIEYISLIELRDIQTGKVFVFPEKGDSRKPLLYEDDFLQHANVSPIKILGFNPDIDCAWDVPDSVILEPQQLEINEIRTQRMLHRRMAIRKILYEKEAISEEQLNNLLSPVVTAGVQVEDLSGIELNALVADIPQSLLLEEEGIIRDVRHQQGMSRNQFGEFNAGSGDTTATEATIVRMASELRIDERRDILSDLLVDTMNDVNRIIFNLWKSEQVIDIVGPGGFPLYVAFRPQMLKESRFDLTVDPDTSVPQTRQVRFQEALGVYAAFRDNPLVNQFLLTQHVLRETGIAAFEHMLRTMDLGSGGMSPDNPLGVVDFTNLLGRLQQGAPAVPSTVPASGSAAGNGAANIGGLV